MEMQLIRKDITVSDFLAELAEAFLQEEGKVTERFHLILSAGKDSEIFVQGAHGVVESSPMSPGEFWRVNPRAICWTEGSPSKHLIIDVSMQHRMEPSLAV